MCRKISLDAAVTTSAAASPSLSHCLPMNDAQFALVSSIFSFGGLVGALCTGDLATKKGRLLTMRLMAAVFSLGSVIEACAASMAVLALGRFLSGVGAGVSVVVVPIYISEIAPLRDRGLFGVMTQISINLGLLLTQIAGYYLSHGNRWRIILAIGAAVGLLQSSLLLLLPESPAWAAANGDVMLGKGTLQRIRGGRCDISDEIASWDLATGIDETESLIVPRTPSPSMGRQWSSSSPAHGVGMLSIALDPFYRPALIAVGGLLFAQQALGINSVIMYGVSLLSDIFPGRGAAL
jgi:MFS family permease